jgi:hypothetical protein
MTRQEKRQLLAAERRRVAECNRRAAKTFAEMDAVNSKPIPRAAYEVEPSLGVGGSAGFSRNGYLWSGKKPR